MSKQTITLDAPVALPGDRVQVRNYRFRPPRWESGVAGAVRYTIYGNFARWSYDVILNRRPAYSLTVGGEDLIPDEEKP